MVGRKTLVAANTNTREHELIIDRSLGLQAEVDRLRAQLAGLAEQLMAERFRRNELEAVVQGWADAGIDRSVDPPLAASPASSDGNVYVFEEQDDFRAAFDEFFTAPDPHLDKVRRFLLD